MKRSFLVKAAACGAALCLFIFGGHQAKAQRTVWGQPFFTVNFTHGFTPANASKVMGLEAYYGEYKENHYWQAGVEFTLHSKVEPVSCFVGSYGLMYRLSSNSSRSFNIYVGGNVFMGVDFKTKKVSDEEVIISDDSYDTEEETEVKEYGSKFVYGIEPRIEFEIFLSRNTAFILGANAPIKFKSQQDKASGRGFAGIRVNF